MMTLTAVLSINQSSKIKRQNNHPTEPSLKRRLKVFQKPFLPIGSSLKRSFKAFQSPFYTNRTFPKKAFESISKVFNLLIGPFLERSQKHLSISSALLEEGPFSPMLSIRIFFLCDGLLGQLILI